MTSPHMTIRDIDDNQKQQEAARSQQIADMGYGLNRRNSLTVDGDAQITERQQKRAKIVQLNPGGSLAADFTIDMFDANERQWIFLNNTSFFATLRNSAGGGANQPVLLPGDALWVHYDGSTFIELARSAPKGAEFLGFSELIEGSGSQTTDVFGDLDSLPEIVEEGDLLIACLSRSDNANSSMTLTSSHGYTGAINVGGRNTQNAHFIQQSYKIAGSSEDSSPHWTSSHTCYWRTWMLHFRKIDQSTPFDTQGNIGFVNGGTYNLSASPANAFNLCVWSVIIRSVNVDQSCLITNPADMELLVNNRDASPSDDRGRARTVIGYRTFFVAGATGTQQFTFGGGGACSLSISTIQEGAGIQAHYNSD